MIDYHRPTDLETALAIRQRYAAQERALTVLAGGTDVVPARTTRAGWGAMRHPDVLDISAIRELRGIAREADGWRIGALATWTDVIRAELPPAFDGLRQAAREVGGVQIQNRGTIAGNVCNASPAADGVPCLLTLEARVETRSTRGHRSLPLAAFVTGSRSTALAPDEIVTAIRIPETGGRGGFIKLGARRYLVISIAMVAALVDIGTDGRIADARIAIGSCSAVAQRQPALERWLSGRDPGLVDSASITPDLLSAVAPITDVRASADYRRQIAVELVRDLLSRFTEPDRRSAA